MGMRENLRKVRKARKWTQQEVADKIGVTLNYYQRVEYGRIGGAFWVWDALEDLFGVHQRILRESSINDRWPDVKIVDSVCMQLYQKDEKSAL